VGVFGEVILQGRVLVISLIVTECEGNHVVEHSHFHRSECTWNGFSLLYAHDIT